TVVFAAWDASTLGAQGAAYYVANPQYAFDNTIAVFQLKMAGAGADTLFVDQNSAFEQEIELAAGALDVPVEITALPDGDQTPFNRAGVPTSLLTWYGDERVTYQSGQLGDTTDQLRVDKLQQYGQIVELTLLGFTEAEAQVNAMLAERSAALEFGDLDAFLATTEAAYISFDQMWFADVQNMTPVSFDMELLDLELGGAEARGTVQVTYALPPEGEGEEPDSHTEIMTARFEHTSAGWQWAGPVLVPLTITEEEATAEETPEGEVASEDEVESDPTPPVAASEDLPITIYHDPSLADDLSAWPQIINERYAAIAEDLGLPVDTEAQVWLFLGSKSLALSVGLSDQADVEHWVGDGVVKLMYDDELLDDPALTDALVQLAMFNTGVQPEATPWLWRGLPLVYRSRQDFVGVQNRYAPFLVDAFAEGTEIDPESDLAAWATMEYARQQLGWNGLAAFVRNLGAACQTGSCEDIGENYATGWEPYWRSEVESAQAALAETLSEIENAVLAGDQNAYLRLIDTSVPGLRADAASWFAAFAEHPAERFVLSGNPVAFFDDGSMLAEVSQEYALADSESSAGADGLLTTRIRFTSAGSGYRWAGAYQQQLGGTITVLYPASQSELAETLQAEASSIYTRLAEYLQIGDPASLVLKLYTEPSAFRSAVPLTVGGDVSAYSRAGESVRLLVSEEDESYRAVLADQLARNLLYQMGVDSEWLLSGVATHLSAQFDGGATQQAAGQYILRVRLAVQNEEIYDLRDLPSAFSLPEEEAGKVKAQAWDSVRYLVDEYGWNTLLAVLRSQAGGASVDRAVSSATGVDLDTFVAEWGASLVNGHASQAWIDTAMTFDTDAAQAHIAALTTPEMAGREAGSEGGRLAADYIAAKFAEYGLQPLGDVVEAPVEPETEAAPEEGAPVEAESGTEAEAGGEVQAEIAGLAVGEPGYLQHFPIEYTELAMAPRFDIVDTGSLIIDSLTYRQDFLSVLYDPKGESKISGELVLVSDSSYTGMDLTGKIVIRNIGEDSLTAEMEKVIEHGGVGLILIGNEENPKVTYAKHPIPYASEDVETLPILELTQDGYKRLLEAVGFTQAEFYQAPAALPLGSRGLIEISLSVPQQVETANVLGFLPGSDPILGQEVIILGAHYDHSGNDPDMLVCPKGANAETEVGCQTVPGATYFGANDNASGVAVLLEIARLWHESGYQPKRSVLFAAWGAQELGQVGSAYYLEHPVVPLEETVFMVQMDAVGGGSGHYLE
ncbi:MAG: M28 family peptidase, partial [Anaerolineales bacterium]|nr:M28 family peptidase [Anaerolineales bacterium]